MDVASAEISIRILVARTSLIGQFPYCECAGLSKLGLFVFASLLRKPIYYVSMRPFYIRVPLSIVWAVTPAIIAAGGVPITPVGLGPLQAAAVGVFKNFASPTRVIAVYLALSTAMLVYRLPLGIEAAMTLTEVISKRESWAILAIDESCDRQSWCSVGARVRKHQVRHLLFHRKFIAARINVCSTENP